MVPRWRLITAVDVREVGLPSGDNVVAGHDVVAFGLQRESESGLAQVRGVVLEHVAGPPPVEDFVGLETISRRSRSGVVLDEPSVALYVDPRVRVDDAGSIEGIAAENAVAGALLDIDALRGGVRDGVALDKVPVAGVGFAVGDVAPVALGGADVDALAELRLPKSRVTDRVVQHVVVGAVVSEVDGLVADAGDREVANDGV